MRERATVAHGRVIAVSILLLVLALAAPAAAQTIAFVQGNYAVPQAPQATVAVTYSAAQTAGNLNVVLVGWNDSTATVTSVTDSRGNAYSLAVGPTVLAGQASQSIYYARNIAAAAAGANVVTVNFSAAAVYPDIRVLEYRGLDTTAPLVGSAAATGTSATANSGSLTTTVPNVLLVAGNVVQTTTSGAGASFTSRIITSPDGDIAEDRIVAAAGTYNATAPLGSGYWVMQLVAFKAPSTDTTPPTVTLTAPSAGATVSGSVTVTATASDNVAVAGVQFKLDGANLGAEVTGTSPYSLTWNTTGATNGSHTLTAVARDTANLTTTSAPVAVTVSNDTTPPTVTITVPSSGATVNGSVTVTATAGDNVAVAGVQFKLDGANLGPEVTGTSPYSLTWNTTLSVNGPHTLTAVARDTSNLTTTSAAVPVTVNNPDAIPPTVAITAPSSGATVSGSVTVTATAADNVAVAGVQFKLDGANLGLEVTGTSPYSLTWSTTGATNGSHTLTAVARDTANLTTTSAPVAVTVSNDVTPPTVTLTVPAAGATVSGSVTVTATAADNVAVAGVQFKLDGANLGLEVTGTSPYSLTWNTTSAANGAHTLTAVARDTANLTTTSAGVPVTVSNAGGTATIRFVQGGYAVPQSPQTTVTVAFPAAQSAGNLNVIAVGWNDSTATVTSVTDSRGNPYALAAAATVIAGKASHAMYYARNIVSAGAGANVVTVRFNVGAAFADVRVLEYSGVDTVNPLLGGVGASGTSALSSSGSLTLAVPNALLVGANVVGTSTSGAGTSFTNRMITSPNADIAEDRIVTVAGTYSATAPLASGYWVMQLAAFAAGSVGPPPPDTTPPTVAITAPTSGATVSGSVTVTATASDNVAVAGVQFKLDGANLGTEVTGASPYSLTWNTAGVTAGPHTLTAVARDTSNLTTTSAPVAVTVSNDTTPPTVAITVPASGATVSASVTLTATASDNVAVAGVQFRLDGANLGGEVTGTSPYSLTWNTTGVANGSHTLTAVARDTSNLTTTSAGVPVTVSNSGGSANIHFVQSNYAVPPSPQSTVAVTFQAAQSAGNLNVIVVGWADSTARVTSVADSRGNAYALAVGPVVLTGSASQSIYYGRNIVAAGAGANVVTVRFTGSAAFPDIRILEYAGLDVVAPLVATTAASGTSTLSSSGSLTTSTPNVLLVAANVVQTTTSGPGANFTSRMITTPNGDIVEDRIVSAAGTYSATAPLANGAWVMQMVAFGTSGGVADTTPPVVAITAPAAGASVAGTVTLAANASDNVGVAGVQFKVDGTNVGAEVTAAPYYVAWNSATVADGTHVVTAVARDQASSTTSSPVSVTVSNATATATSRIGQWSASSSWPLVAVHAALMPNGQVLAWDAAAQQGAARVWNPSTNVFTTANPPDNIFCAGFSPLADGRVFVAGGHIANYIGIPDANIFDPVSRVWSSAPSMAVGRWYPTATLLPDQRVLVVSGAIDCEECIATTPEIYNPATNAWTALPSASLELPIYPHLFVLPNGRVLATSAFEGPSAAVELDVATGTWSVVDPVVTDGHSAAMYRLGKVVKSGTSANSDAPFINSQPTTYVLDMTQPAPAWRQTPPMAFPRAYHNLTLLPDGSVLVTGGNKVTDTFNEAQAVLAAELWSPATETWTTLASMTIPRLYHSLALLLPDGRVLVTGGGRFGNPTGDSHDKLNAQMYSPPYLFKGTRPVITSVASDIPYGFTFSVATPDAARIASVVLIKLGSVTHGFNQAQRYVPLSFSQVGGALNVQAPTSAADALPGHYMLFIVDTNGIPSVAPIVRIE